jgi:U3 small nucleolar RNA-associated protein 14
MDPEEAKSRLRDVRKQRSLVFYEEIKRRRISKIKSKLYHRIKKRQRMKEELNKFNNMEEE